MSGFLKSRCTPVSFEEMEQLLASDGFSKTGDCPFVLPFWLQLWEKTFAPAAKSCLVMVSVEQEPIGIAPLKRQGAVVSFMGNEDLFDYQDMKILPGREAAFFSTLLVYLRQQGVKRLQLGALRPDSTVMRFLPSIARDCGCRTELTDAGRLYAMELPATWQAYLEGLGGKHRHELRRKYRRFKKAGTLQFAAAADGDSTGQWLEMFFHMFAASRKDKASFLSQRMRHYFKELAEELRRRQMLRPATLFLDGTAVAAVFGFVSQSTYYLYNSGYLPQYSSLSPGLLCKAMSIDTCIGDGLDRYNFLKGSEPYKKHLGGEAIPLVRLGVELGSGG